MSLLVDNFHLGLLSLRCSLFAQSFDDMDMGVSLVAQKRSRLQNRRTRVLPTVDKVTQIESALSSSLYNRCSEDNQLLSLVSTGFCQTSSVKVWRATGQEEPRCYNGLFFILVRFRS